jgi:hypothetical protein
MIPPACIAYFVSPHGYGHASRAAALMAALQALRPATQFEIFTQVPRWFFADSLSNPGGYHALLTDIGLAQKNSLVEDLPETVHRLAGFLPFERSQVENLARQVKRLDCQMEPHGQNAGERDTAKIGLAGEGQSCFADNGRHPLGVHLFGTACRPAQLPFYCPWRG